jgi:hypothetical protein
MRLSFLAYYNIKYKFVTTLLLWTHLFVQTNFKYRLEVGTDKTSFFLQSKFLITFIENKTLNFLWQNNFLDLLMFVQ